MRDRELQKQFKREKARREAEKERLQAKLAARQLKEAVAQEKVGTRAAVAVGTSALSTCLVVGSSTPCQGSRFRPSPHNFPASYRNAG